MASPVEIGGRNDYGQASIREISFNTVMAEVEFQPYFMYPCIYPRHVALLFDKQNRPIGFGMVADLSDNPRRGTFVDSPANATLVDEFWKLRNKLWPIHSDLLVKREPNTPAPYQVNIIPFPSSLMLRGFLDYFQSCSLCFDFRVVTIFCSRTLFGFGFLHIPRQTSADRNLMVYLNWLRESIHNLKYLISDAVEEAHESVQQNLSAQRQRHQIDSVTHQPTTAATTNETAMQQLYGNSSVYGGLNSSDSRIGQPTSHGPVSRLVQGLPYPIVSPFYGNSSDSVYGGLNSSDSRIGQPTSHGPVAGLVQGLPYPIVEIGGQDDYGQASIREISFNTVMAEVDFKTYFSYPRDVTLLFNNQNRPIGFGMVADLSDNPRSGPFVDSPANTAFALEIWKVRNHLRSLHSDLYVNREPNTPAPYQVNIIRFPSSFMLRGFLDYFQSCSLCFDFRVVTIFCSRTLLGFGFQHIPRQISADRNLMEYLNWLRESVHYLKHLISDQVTRFVSYQVTCSTKAVQTVEEAHESVQQDLSAQRQRQQIDSVTHQPTTATTTIEAAMQQLYGNSSDSVYGGPSSSDSRIGPPTSHGSTGNYPGGRLSGGHQRIGSNDTASQCVRIGSDNMTRQDGRNNMIPNTNQITLSGPNSTDAVSTCQVRGGFAGLLNPDEWPLPGQQRLGSNNMTRQGGKNDMIPRTTETATLVTGETVGDASVLGSKQTSSRSNATSALQTDQDQHRQHSAVADHQHNTQGSN